MVPGRVYMAAVEAESQIYLFLREAAAGSGASAPSGNVISPFEDGDPSMFILHLA